MLSDLIKIITPEALASAIRSNPAVVQSALQKFDAYTAFGQALSNEQQIVISNNLYRLDVFFRTEAGKKALSNLADEFSQFVVNQQPVKEVPTIDEASLRAKIEAEVRAEMIEKATSPAVKHLLTKPSK